MKIADLLNPEDGSQDIPPAEKSAEPIRTEPVNFCSICQRSFGRYSEYSRHLKTIHPTSRTQWHVCPNPGCGKRFTRADALRDHLKTKKARLYNCRSPVISKKSFSKAAIINESTSQESSQKS